jgi:glycerophosphoryl diester phosphodiesterase
MLDRTTISSFAWTALAVFRTLAQPCGAIGLVRRRQYDELGLGGVLGLARAHGVDEIGLHAAQFRDGALAQAAAQGIRVGLYRVDSPRQIEAALRAAVSAFTTDRPDLAVERRRALYATAGSGRAGDPPVRP